MEDGHNYEGDDDDSSDGTMEVNSEDMEGMYDLMFGVDSHSDDDSGDSDASHDEDAEDSSGEEEMGHNYEGEEVDINDLADTDSEAMVIEPTHSNTDDDDSSNAATSDDDNDTDTSPNQPDLPSPSPTPASHTIESTDTTSNIEMTHTSPTVTTNKTLSSDTIYNIVTPNPIASASTTTSSVPITITTTTTSEVTYTPQHAITALAEAAHTVLLKRLVEELYHACLKNIVAAFILVRFVASTH